MSIRVTFWTLINKQHFTRHLNHVPAIGERVAYDNGVFIVDSVLHDLENLGTEHSVHVHLTAV